MQWCTLYLNGNCRTDRFWQQCWIWLVGNWLKQYMLTLSLFITYAMIYPSFYLLRMQWFTLYLYGNYRADRFWQHCWIWLVGLGWPPRCFALNSSRRSLPTPVLGQVAVISFCYRFKLKIILLFNFFFLLFINSVIFFDTIHKSHCIIFQQNK